MKLVMTLLVRDNAETVGTNIAYHLSRGVDHVIVTDNRSVDATRAIVEEFVRAGKASLIDEPRDDFDQAAWVTRMARAACAMDADWVINNDADEMWWPVKGDLKATLEKVPPKYGSLIVPRTNALPLRRIGGHPFERMVLRHARSTNALGDPLPGKAVHRAASDVFVKPGNHSVTSASLGAAAATRSMIVFHFPYLGYDQFARKVATGGAAVERSAALSGNAADAWRRLYDRLRAGTLRAWYDALLHGDDPEIEMPIARGDVVRDTRLAHYLRDMNIVVPQ